MMPQPTPFQLVSAAATKANILPPAEDLARIKSCRPDSKLAKWVQSNLVPERVLSREEVGLRDVEAEAGGASGVVPLTEEELLIAIAELEGETARLQRETERLEVDEQRRSSAAEKERRRREFAEGMRERVQAKMRNLEGKLGVAREEVEILLREMDAGVEKTMKSIPGLMRGVLGKHDTVLRDLNLKEGGLGELQMQTVTETSISIEMVEQLSTLLASMLAEELHVRLDRVYLEALHGGLNDDSSQNRRTQQDPAGDATVLQQDLNSLYAEIPNVAAMFVAQQYSEPLLRALREVERKRDYEARMREERVVGVIDGLVGDLEELKERLEGFHSWRVVVGEMREGCEGGVKQGDGVGLDVRKARGGDGAEMGEAMQTMLRHFGVGAKESRYLHQVIDDKIKKLQEGISLEGLHSGVKEREVYDERKRILETLESGIEGDHWGVDNETKLEALEARILGVREEVEALRRADTRDGVRRQRDFVERWS